MVIDKVRRAVEMLYQDTATVYVNEPVEDPITHATTSDWVVKYKDIKCRISFNKTSADYKDAYDSSGSTPTLFVAPEVDIPPGSRVEVTRTNMGTVAFRASEMPKVYNSHQEISLNIEKEN